MHYVLPVSVFWPCSCPTFDIDIDSRENRVAVVVTLCVRLFVFVSLCQQKQRRRSTRRRYIRLFTRFILIVRGVGCGRRTIRSRGVVAGWCSFWLFARRRITNPRWCGKRGGKARQSLFSGRLLRDVNAPFFE